MYVKGKPFRVKVATGGTVFYFVRDEKGKVSIVNGREKTVELALLAGNGSAELRFELEDCHPDSATKIIRHYIPVVVGTEDEVTRIS